MQSLVDMLLAGVGREYPHKPGHTQAGPADLRPARELNPVFYGCFDWHSAVHTHWALVRLLHVQPKTPWHAAVHEVLDARFTPANLHAEAAFLALHSSFEVPYGLAWLLQLGHELRQMHSPWTKLFTDLETIASTHMQSWLSRLSYPIRSGEHSQSAFAMGLLWDWAHDAGRQDLAHLVRTKAVQFYMDDQQAPMRYEPSGHDFLSPILGEADLMRRVLLPSEFRPWMEQFSTDLASFEPVTAVDRTDGKSVHFDGLNLSRAWMLEGVAARLSLDEPHRTALLDSARRHGDTGLASLEGASYAGSHWLGSFAVYWQTQRGLT